jgi:hypothetical protein
MCCVCCQGEAMPITRAAGNRPLIIGLAALPPRQWKNACEQQNTPGSELWGARCQLRFASGGVLLQRFPQDAGRGARRRGRCRGNLSGFADVANDPASARKTPSSTNMLKAWNKATSHATLVLLQAAAPPPPLTTQDSRTSFEPRTSAGTQRIFARRACCSPCLPCLSACDSLGGLPGDSAAGEPL